MPWSAGGADWQAHAHAQVLLRSTLNDCQNPMDAVRLATMWKDEKITRGQLLEVETEDASSLNYAFEWSLSNVDAAVAGVLVDFNADARLVRFDKLCDEQMKVHDEFGRLSNEGFKRFGLLPYKLDEEARLHLEKQFNMHPECGLGFAVLGANLDELVGYKKTYLSARGRMCEKAGRQLTPNWMDLMLWAVVLGKQDLAKLLWTRTEEPMRAAVIASRLCRKRYSKLQDGSEKHQLIVAADQFEEWATGMLEVSNAEQCMLMQKSYPFVPEELWPGSTIECAIGDGDDLMCRKFIAHRRSKDLFQEVGDEPCVSLRARGHARKERGRVGTAG